MVYRRKFKKTFRKPYRKRTFSKQSTAVRTRRLTPRSNLKTDDYAFKRSFIGTTVTGNVAYNPFTAGIQFTLNQLPSWGEFANLFDRYMITYVKMYVHLKIDPSAQTAANASFPKLYWIKDFDDANAPASINEMREHSKCQYRVLNPNRPVVIGIKPSVLSLAYRSAVTSTYVPKWRQWIDMATTDVPHYGIKVAIDNLQNTNYQVDFEYKVWIKCKDTR